MVTTTLWYTLTILTLSVYRQTLDRMGVICVFTQFSLEEEKSSQSFIAQRRELERRLRSRSLQKSASGAYTSFTCFNFPNILHNVTQLQTSETFQPNSLRPWEVYETHCLLGQVKQFVIFLKDYRHGHLANF